jgi:NAD dependent epimerase/dehydratase family
MTKLFSHASNPPTTIHKNFTTVYFPHCRNKIFCSPHEIIRAKEATQNDLKAFISSEIRSHLIDSATGRSGKSEYPPIKKISDSERLRILVTGGSGFVGSHLVDRLMMAGHQVTVVDNMFTGRKKNIAHWIGHPNFLLIIHDVVEPIMMEVRPRTMTHNPSARFYLLFEPFRFSNHYFPLGFRNSPHENSVPLRRSTRFITWLAQHLLLTIR